MHTLQHKRVSLGFIIIGVLLFASCAKSQTESRATASVIRGPHPAWEGTASGKLQPFSRNSEDFRIAVLTQPVPDVWLEFVESKREGQPPHKSSFEKEPVIQVALPTQAKEALKSFWERSLEFVYQQAFDRAKTGQAKTDRDRAWLRYFSTTVQELEKIEIAAPDGTRRISDEEADRLVDYLGKASASLLKSAT